MVLSVSVGDHSYITSALVGGEGGTVRQKLVEVQSLELHQYNIAMVLSINLIKNKVFLHY